MKLTEHQEEIYVRHVALLKQYKNPTYSERAIRQLEDSYRLYCELKDQNIKDYACTKEDVWQELASLPIDDDLTANMVEEIERRIYVQKSDYNTIMRSIIELQMALGVPVKQKYYSIFLVFFDSLFLEIISKHYRDRYGQESCKVKTIEKKQVYLS